jgi:hypothetical protein
VFEEKALYELLVPNQMAWDQAEQQSTVNASYPTHHRGQPPAARSGKVEAHCSSQDGGINKAMALWEY